MDVYITRAHNINTHEAENIMDCATLDAVFRQYYKNVYNYISFRINNHHDAEELAATVFEKAVGRYHTYKPEVAPVEAWLIGISRNVVTDYLRSKRPRFFVPIEDIINLSSAERQPDEVVVLNEEHKDIMKAMSKLKDKERQVLSMKFATDLKNSEIANLLGISESNVGVIVFRAVKKLKGLVEKES